MDLCIFLSLNSASKSSTIGYYLRWYALYSGRDASYGEIWLYDPELERVKIWLVPVLQCVVHEGCDGLTANPNGETHGVIIPVPVSLMEEAGTYRFVLHFYDDYADTYKNHQVKATLEVNAITCIPEIHNYDGIDFSPSANEAQSRQERVGYISRAWTNEDPIKAMARVEGKEESNFKRPTIVFIANHGLPGAIWFRGPFYAPEVSEGWKAKPYMSGRGDDIFYRFSAISNHDFSKVIFIAFVGCYTSQTHADRGNLLVEAIKKNATTALGFKEIIIIGTNQDDDPNTPENERSNIVTNWTKAF